MRPQLSRLTVWLTVLVALVAITSRASAQCAITGPSEVCGTAVTLCAPDGAEVYEWTLPDGSMEFSQCITVTAPGTYSMRYFDVTGNWTTPCEHVLTSGGAAPSITGGASACEGTAIDLCGPSGDWEYEWTGPLSFSASTMCVSAGVAGTWQLRVRPLGNQCWSEWASHDVAFTTCQPDPSPSPSPSPSPEPSPSPSPSPSPGPGPNCPRAAWWWSQQCPDHDRSRVRLDAATMSSIAACVASHDLDLDGNFCATMNGGRRTLRMRARRQVAAVWANICAGGMGVTTRDGRPVTLDAAAAVDLAEFQGTVGSWLAQAGTTLGAMGATSGRGAKKAEDDACRKVIRVAWQLNHGIGIGPVCRPDHPPVADDRMVLGTRDESAVAIDPEPLEAELMADVESALAFGVIQPNPVRSHMTMAYAITTTEAQDVTIGVYDLNGRLVRELVHGMRTPGEYVATWDGLDRNGSAVRGGFYFVLGRIAGERVQQRVTLVR